MTFNLTYIGLTPKIGLKHL